jgi:outer membrane protein TolC
MKHIFFLTILSTCVFVNAQASVLSIDSAISLALKNNYDLLIAHNNAEIAKINNTAGNAGMLPSVSLSGTDNQAFNIVNQKTSSGTNTNNLPVRSNSASAGAELNWTLFDGGKMFVTKKVLNEIDSLGQIQFKDKVLQTAYSVVEAYYNVVRQKQESALLSEVLSYNTDRVSIIQTEFTAGLMPKTTLLQAQIDLNVYKENAITQDNVIKTAKRTLNVLLGRNPSTEFDVQDSIPFDFNTDTARVFEKLYANNTSILSYKKQLAVSRLNIKEISALRYPKINLNAGYDFSNIDNSAGSTLLNRTSGPYIGGAISIPVYQSGEISRRIANAKLQMESAQYDLDNATRQAEARLRNSIDEFESQNRLLLIEKNNSLLAKENLDISMQRMRLGQSTSLELRQAEESYEEARTRQINIEYNLKMAETSLKQLLADFESIR